MQRGKKARGDIEYNISTDKRGKSCLSNHGCRIGKENGSSAAAHLDQGHPSIWGLQEVTYGRVSSPRHWKKKKTPCECFIRLRQCCQSQHTTVLQDPLGAGVFLTHTVQPPCSDLGSGLWETQMSHVTRKPLVLPGIPERRCSREMLLGGCCT